MSEINLLYTPIYASILGVFYLLLTFNVIKNRVKYKVVLSDNDHTSLRRAIRAHANFIEYVPLILILIMILEINRLPPLIINILGLLLLIGRSLHAYSIIINEVKNKTIVFRQIGMVMTLLVIIISICINLSVLV